ncbi:MAG: hypothetical protein OEY87_07550 [Gammaproteobacteria bacterium]|nr:hypothetical protein [Gammaproteobacteria bacterium]
MQIDGPFSISIVNNAESHTRELHLKFYDSFQNSLLDDRIALFSNYIGSINTNLINEFDTQSRQGMETILQISEQLLPHIINDEISLDETIIIEIGPSSPFDHLLNSATLK